VYSAALRQVGSPEAAAEIAQNVFLGLARGAQALVPRLSEEASLAGWLCRSTRNLSLNFRRDEFRRQSRQRKLMEQLGTTSEDAPDWEHLCGVLDDAMSQLNEADYDLLVLRFYKSLDYRAVGVAMGLSDGAAQKRVSRALEKLRQVLSRRGIRTGAAALSLVIAANAVQAAPAGLTVTISSVALAGATSPSTIIAANQSHRHDHSSKVHLDRHCRSSRRSRNLPDPPSLAMARTSREPASGPSTVRRSKPTIASRARWPQKAGGGANGK
jgi:RNA polymerase sigma factor (sigma-70 family)